jgi:hypothetical protein
VTLDHFLATLAGTCLVAAALCWFGPALDGDLHADPAAVTGLQITITAEHAADADACQRMHGPRAVAVHFPDGQHRCTDARGRRLSSRSGIVLVEEVQP